MLKLYIGNKNCSSWSMRAWVLMRQAGIPFQEVRIRLDSLGAGSAMIRQAAIALALALACSASVRADPVLDGARETLEMLRGIPPSARARIRAVADLAVFDALNAIDRRYPAAADAPPPQPQASPEAAIASARWTSLAAQPEVPHGKLLAWYRAALERIPDSRAKSLGVSLGQRAAGGSISSMSAGMRATTVARFDPGTPPPIDGPQAQADVAEVQAIGDARSAVRSADQTAAVLFWDASHDADLLPVFAGIAASRGMASVEAARMLATWSVAEHEASIAIGALKRKYAYPRPDAALRGSAPAWTALLRMPTHSEYPSGGAVVAGVYERVLEQSQQGTGSRVVITNGALGMTRAWDSPRELAAELADSRIWGGLHYRGTVDASRRLGRTIATDVLSRSGLAIQP